MRRLGSSFGHISVRHVRLPSLVPALLAAILFKLAISGGGRHVDTLAFAQATILLATVVVVWSKAVPSLAGLRSLVAVAVVTGGSVLWSVRQDSTIGEFLLWSTYAGIFALTAWTLSGLTAARRFLDAAVAIVGWVCLIAVYLYWGSNGPDRWSGTFYSSNVFAAFVLLVLPLEIARCAHALRVRDALSHGTMSVLLLTAFLLTYSRGAWLSLTVTAPLAVLILKPPSWQGALRRLAVIAILSFVLSGALARWGNQQSVLERAVSTSGFDNASIQGRLHFWRAAVGIFLDRPLQGSGAGTYAFIAPQYQKDVRYYSRSAHNLYLQILAELGLVGAILFLVLLFNLVKLWVRCLRKAQGSDAYSLVAGVGIGLASFLVHSALEMNVDFPANPAMAFALAGTLASYDTCPGVREETRRREEGMMPIRKVILSAGLILLAVVAGVRLLAERHFQEARLSASQGRWAAAASELQRAVRFNPVNASYVFGWGQAMDRVTPGSSKVLSAMQRGMALDSQNAYYPINLARTLIESGAGSPGNDEAVRLLRKGLRLDPYHYPEAFGMLAALYRRRGDEAAVDLVYQEAMARYLGYEMIEDRILQIRLWPRVAQLFLERARLLEGSGRTREAVDLYEVLLRDDRTLVPAYLQLANYYLREGQRERAETLLAAGLHRVQSSDEIWVRWRTLPQHRSAIWER